MVFNATFNNISVLLLLLWGLVLLVVKTGVPGENRTLDYPFIFFYFYGKTIFNQ